MGELMSAGDSEAVATWYSSGWNTWWLRRSINRHIDRRAGQRLGRREAGEATADDEHLGNAC